MADKFYTYELANGSETKLASITTSGTFAEFVRDADAKNRAAGPNGFQIKKDTLRDFPTPEARAEYVADYRSKLGKAPSPTSEELKANAERVFGKVRSADPKAVAAAAVKSGT